MKEANQKLKGRRRRHYVYPKKYYCSGIGSKIESLVSWETMTKREIQSNYNCACSQHVPSRMYFLGIICKNVSSFFSLILKGGVTGGFCSGSLFSTALLRQCLPQPGRGQAGASTPGLPLGQQDASTWAVHLLPARCISRKLDLILGVLEWAAGVPSGCLTCLPQHPALALD